MWVGPFEILIVFMQSTSDHLIPYQKDSNVKLIQCLDIIMLFVTLCDIANRCNDLPYAGEAAVMLIMTVQGKPQNNPWNIWLSFSPSATISANG